MAAARRLARASPRAVGAGSRSRGWALRRWGSQAPERRVRGRHSQAGWDLPRPEVKLTSPALAGRVPSTTPPGKPELFIFVYLFLNKYLCI